MSPAEIAARLDERFRLLTGGRRTAVERHQTLRATVDWSYSLLADTNRRVFDRLGVFAGSFDARGRGGGRRGRRRRGVGRRRRARRAWWRSRWWSATSADDGTHALPHARDPASVRTRTTRRGRRRRRVAPPPCGALRRVRRAAPGRAWSAPTSWRGGDGCAPSSTTSECGHVVARLRRRRRMRSSGSASSPRSRTPR